MTLLYHNNCRFYHHEYLFLFLMIYIYLILLNVTNGSNNNEKYYTIIVFQNGENLNINHGIKVNISMYDLISIRHHPTPPLSHPLSIPSDRPVAAAGASKRQA